MKIEAPGQMGTPTNSNYSYEPTRFGRGPKVDVELFNCSRVYRCIVLRRIMPDIQRDLRATSTRYLLQVLWAEGGEARKAAEEEVRGRLFGDRGVAA